jgi:pilus assembly protein FimV
MIRKSVLAATVAAILTPAVANALGLGGIEVDSGLNQPLKARIPVRGASPGELEELRAVLGSDAQFRRAGLERPFMLTRLAFAVVDAGAGNVFIEISTRDPVSEPFLNFLVDVSWSRGRMVREYTLLLDPPVYGAAITSGSQQRVQTVEAAPRMAAPQRPEEPARAAAPDSAPAPAPMRRATPPYAGDSYGPVREGETLWSIAERARPEGASIQSMMLALLKANPEAFNIDNINALRSGAVLRIPPASELLEDKSVALAEVVRQHALWEEYRLSLPGVVTAQPAGAQAAAPLTPAPTPAAPTPDAAPAPAGEDRTKLELVGAASAAAGTDGNALEALRNEVALAQEEVDAARQQNDDLRTRLEEAESLVGDLKRLVELKEDQLADLQNQLASATDKPAPAPQPPAPPVKPAPAPAPKPMPAPAPKPAPSATSFLDEVNAMLPVPLWSIGGGLVALLVGVAGLRWSRRRKEAAGESVATSDLDADETVVGEDAFGESSADLTGEVTEATETTVAGEHTQLAAGLGGEPIADEDEDPLAEVNVYLAYERFDQAEELVRDAIERYPARHDYRLKLLEVFYASKNAASFQAAAQQLHEVVGDDDAMTQQAREWWAELGTGGDLFGEATLAGPDARTVGSETEEVFNLSGATQAGDEETGVDFDLGLGGGEERKAPSGVDFDLGDLAEEAPDEGAGGASSAGTNLDFDLSDLGETPAGSGSQEVGLGSGTDLDFDLSALEAGAEGAAPAAVKDEAGKDTGLDFDLSETMTVSPEDLEGASGTDSEVGAPAGGADTGLDFELGDTTLFPGDDEAPPTLPGVASTLDADIEEVVATDVDEPLPEAGGVSSLDFELDATGAADVDGTRAGEDSMDAGGDSSFDFDLDDTRQQGEQGAGAGGDSMDIGGHSGLDLEPEIPGDAAAEAVPSDAEVVVEAGESGLDFDVGDAAPTSAGGTGTGEGSRLDLDLGEGGPLGGGDAAAEISSSDLEIDADSTISLADAGATTVPGPGPAPADEEDEEEGGLTILEVGIDTGVTVEGDVWASTGPTAAEEGQGEDEDEGEKDAGAGAEAPDEDLQGAITQVGDELGAELESVFEVEEGASVDDGPALEFDFPTDLGGAGGEDEDRSALLGSGASGEVDENQTKLDLAQAYIDMGDREGARNLLDEVVAAGSEDQQGQAREMLGKLS